MRKLLLALLLCGTAQAADDVLLKAVSFALTGTDDAHITAVDWNQCVFRVDKMNLSETFHLNKVDPARLTFEQMKSTSQYGDISYFVEVSIFGEGTVYEMHIEGAPPMEGAASHQLQLPTREYQRVVRAWKYVYSHGCKGRPSSF